MYLWTALIQMYVCVIVIIIITLETRCFSRVSHVYRRCTIQVQFIIGYAVCWIPKWIVLKKYPLSLWTYTRISMLSFCTGQPNANVKKQTRFFFFFCHPPTDTKYYKNLVIIMTKKILFLVFLICRQVVFARGFQLCIMYFSIIVYLFCTPCPLGRKLSINK